MDSEKKPEISVVIPVYNAGKTLGKCLESVYQSKYPPCEVIVVDDCSTDDTVAVAERFPCKVVKLEQNQGAARAKNRGAEEAKGDVIFFTDADILLNDDALSAVVEDFAKFQISGVVGLLSKETRYDNFFSEYKNLWMHFTYVRLPKYIGVFYTSAAAIKRDIFKDHGGFNEKYRGASVTEDAEFGQRLFAAGHKLYLDKRIAVKHLKGYSFISLLKTDFWRPYGLTKTALRNKLAKAYDTETSRVARTFTSVPRFFIMSVFTSFLTMFLAFLSIVCRDYRFLIAALVGCLVILLFNYSFLKFLKKTRGGAFLIKSCFMLVVDTFTVVFGMSFATATYILGKKF